MIVTGIAHPPARIYERSHIPSTELVYLATKALKHYHAGHLVTSLSMGWEQALAEAAIELEVPYTVAVPYPGREVALQPEAQALYRDLVAHAVDVFHVNEVYCETALMESHYWRIDQSEVLLALWDYDFRGETHQVMEYAIKKEKQVVNLWKDWEYLYSLRKTNTPVATYTKRTGAQVF